jgi:hypothetical protein
MRFTKRNPKKYETKRNFTFDETKRNKTKRNFAVYFVSRNKRNFAKQIFVSLCFVFCETKKMMRNGNPTRESSIGTKLRKWSQHNIHEATLLV